MCHMQLSVVATLQIHTYGRGLLSGKWLKITGKMLLEKVFSFILRLDGRYYNKLIRTFAGQLRWWTLSTGQSNGNI